MNLMSETIEMRDKMRKAKCSATELIKEFPHLIGFNGDLVCLITVKIKNNNFLFFEILLLVEMLLQMHIEFEHVCGTADIDETLPEKVLRNDKFFDGLIQNGNLFHRYNF